jgi:SAM-dependent methyltransferase
MVKALEERFPAPGYEMVVEALYRELGIQAGQTLLEVGIGSGACTRWLAKRTAGASNITGVDLNPYLLSESNELIHDEGLEGRITIKPGNATSLPFPDDSFDASISVTVLEECDANTGLAEMMRVTRPGGRIAVAVRAEDVPGVVNVDLPPDLKSAAERIQRGVSANGCGDATLYTRCAEAGLQNAHYFIASETQVDPGSAAVSLITGNISAADRVVWDEAFQRAVGDGTFFVTRFLHCAVGNKPAKS